MKKLSKLFVSLMFLNLLFQSCAEQNHQVNNVIVKPFVVKGLDTLKTNTGLNYILVKSNPEGKLPAAGKKVKVNYTGYFTDGKIFDSSVQRGQALEFTLGVGRVIPGWEQGIALLHEGEQARLIIPYDLGYGVEGSDVIPPMSTLIFDIELINVEQ